MQLEPAVSIMRFQQMEPGALGIFDLEGCTFVALKLVDSDADPDEFILPLGPELPRDVSPGRFIAGRACTVVSFGKQYTVRLPTGVEGWAIENEPTPEHLALVLTKGHTYVRVNANRRSGIFEPCFVGLHDGKIVYDGVGTIRAYVTHWEIVVPDKSFPSRVLVSIGMSKRESA